MADGIATQALIAGLGSFVDPTRLRNMVVQTYAQQNYVLAEDLMGVERVQTTEDAVFQIRLASKETGLTSYRPLQRDVLEIAPGPVNVSVPICQLTMNLETYDTTVYANRQITKELIFDVQTEQIRAGLQRLGEDVESRFLRPAASATDRDNIWGVLHWLAPATQANGTLITSVRPSFSGIASRQLTGGATGSFSIIGGRDRSAAEFARLRNPTATRPTSTFGRAEAAQLMRLIGFSKFMPSPIMEGDTQVSDNDLRLYFGQQQHDDLIELANTGPDDQGGQVFRFDGTRFMGQFPVRRCAELDNTGDGSILGLKLSTWRQAHKPGLYMARSGLIHRVDINHNTYATFVDHHANLMCLDPRRNFRFSVAT